MIIEMRRRYLVNTDPQRRCYNGCYAKSELVWGEWDWLELNVPEEKVEQRLASCRELNDFAVSQRGEEARKEFRAVEDYEVKV